MLKLSIAEIAGVVGGEIRDQSGAAEHVVPSGYSIDTRTLTPGELFFALRGVRADGHRFVRDAHARGAVGAVVDHFTQNADSGFIQILVDCPLTALQQLAVHVRGMVDPAAVAITGSNGKTTVKEMTARLLSLRGSVLKNPGNYNNHIGVPLTMLGLDESYDFLVVELGSNHMGEIMQLARWARPDVGVITNTGPAHLGLFGSLENVVREKTDLLRALPPSGRGVLNAGSPAVLQIAKEIDTDIVTFGTEAHSDFRAENIATGPGPGSTFTVRGTPISLRAAGIHNVLNALAAIATASLYDILPEECAGPLESLEPVRVSIERYGRATLIDDTYNANPDSVRAILGVLRATPGLRRVFVMGEMLELGEFSAGLHRSVGTDVAQAGIDVFIGVGGMAREAVDAALSAGFEPGDAVFFEDKSAACRHLQRVIAEGDVLLVKGSRATAMEEVSEYIRRDLIANT